MAIPNEPIERKEFFLAKAAGQSVETPEPITREERYLNAIAEGGGGGGGGSNLPSVTSADNGDVLTVVNGTWDKAAPSGGDSLPEVTASDNGKVLSVVSGEWNKADAPKELPTIFLGDAGKVLTVVDQYNKTVGWANPAGNLPPVTASDNGKVLTVVNGTWNKAAPNGGGVLIVTDIEGQLDKTFGEIHNAFRAGKPVIISRTDDFYGAPSTQDCACVNVAISNSGGEYTGSLLILDGLDTSVQHLYICGSSDEGSINYMYPYQA